MKILKRILLSIAVVVLFATGASFMMSNANASSAPSDSYIQNHGYYVGQTVGGKNVNGIRLKGLKSGYEAETAVDKDGEHYVYAQGQLISKTPENSNSSNSANSNASQSANDANSTNSNTQNGQYQNSNTNNNKLVQTSENKKNKEAAIIGAVFFLAVIGFAYAQHIHMTHVI